MQPSRLDNNANHCRVCKGTPHVLENIQNSIITLPIRDFENTASFLQAIRLLIDLELAATQDCLKSRPMPTHNICPECNSPGTQRPSPPLPPLKSIVARYGQVAKSVNRKEFNRFIAQIRDKWDPFINEEDSEDTRPQNYRHPGWTEECAFAMCVYTQMFDSKPLHPEGAVLCEAEEEGQVLFRPVESFIEDFRGPLFEPCGEEEIGERLGFLRECLQKQFYGLMPGDHGIRVELPEDFRELMRLTDGVEAAGVPSETAHLHLVGSRKYHYADEHMPGEGGHSYESSERARWRVDGIEAFAAWMLGNDRELWRRIYYVLCRESSSEKQSKTDEGEEEEEAPLGWKVIDRYDIEMDVYDNLSQFLQHATDHIEAIPGGHWSQCPLDLHDKYPDQCRY